MKLAAVAHAKMFNAGRVMGPFTLLRRKSRFGDICRQCWPSSDIAERGVRTRFPLLSGIFPQNVMKLKLEMDPSI